MSSALIAERGSNISRLPILVSCDHGKALQLNLAIAAVAGDVMIACPSNHAQTKNLGR
jgi:hypothetical protein